ncbi:MAG: nucleotidyltransferase domain-containing protein [Candidatus Binatia bacterium]|nr:nucleotidyltransferase domain-containing protein [Candidatus Binatia bacterium]
MARLRELAAVLRRELNVEQVYIFGSFARGEEHEGSDIDLLIVGRIPGRMVERIGEILRRTDLPIEPIVLTPEELERARAAGHPLLASIEREAVPI